jgi:hypothetical protein
LRLHQFDQCRQKKRVVVEIAVQVGVIPEPRGQKSSVAPDRALERIGRCERHLRPARLVLRPCGTREARDRERVPRRQDLLVTAGVDALLARGEQPSLRAGQTRARVGKGNIELGGNAFQRFDHAQVPSVVLEVGRAVQSEIACSDGPFVSGDETANLLLRPHVELPSSPSLSASRLGKGPVIVSHFTRQPADDSARDVRALLVTLARDRIEADNGPLS